MIGTEIPRMLGLSRTTSCRLRPSSLTGLSLISLMRSKIRLSCTDRDIGLVSTSGIRCVWKIVDAFDVIRTLTIGSVGHGLQVFYVLLERSLMPAPNRFDIFKSFPV